jgi:hypothetical protein
MKTLKFLFINFFIRDHQKTIDIINQLDGKQTKFYTQKKLPEKVKVYGDMSSLLLPIEDDYDIIDESTEFFKPKSKKDELLEGLNYLKSKNVLDDGNLKCKQGSQFFG